MPLSLNFIRQLFAPTVLLVAGFWLNDVFARVPDNALFLLAYLPYLLFGISALLAVQFNQSRVLFALLNLFLVYALLHATEFSVIRLYEFVLLFWALLNLGVLVWLPERSVLSSHTLVKLAGLGIEYLLSWYVLSFRFLWAEDFFYGSWLGVPPEWMNFSFTLAIVAGFALLSVSIKIMLDTSPISAAMLAWVLMLFAFLSQAVPQALVIALSVSAGIIAFIAIIFDSHQMAYRDELTGLRSRRALNQFLTGLGRKYTIAMMDIDHFKKFNDNHGHDVGDQMLKLVASKIARVKGGGTPFRYGGEEFTVVFPRKSIDEVIAHLENLRESIEGYPLVVRAKDRPSEKPKHGKKQSGHAQTLSCTISIGLASKGGDLKTPEQVIKGADKALYRAKEKGRNCVAV